MVEVEQHWEYADFYASTVGDTIKVISINGQLQDPNGPERSPFDVLNGMGSEGWELIAVVPVVPPNPNAVMPRGVWQYVLKRRR